ncbi:winged helix-turn-helix domain-containing protein [Pseudocitrobacter cyperus]|uniref:Winged helix-turn-helix domain-containing protein n=1 Tax=Pseudocitrobacter cyperus TaxID=3112843 RepID=A0ABV0HID5_9ENTR
MKMYLINNNCIFNEAQYELKNTNNSQVIRMTAMRAKCLSYIIEHAETGVIDRRQLSQALWGNRSEFVSDANLTQILYLIRKDLKSMGISDLIITIPRQGIQVNSQIAMKLHEPVKKTSLKEVIAKSTKTLFTVAASILLTTTVFFNIH